MERKQACIDESTEFLCPTCGASAFEVIDTRRDCGDGDPTEAFLVMRCLDCLDLFYHQLGTQEPWWAPAENAEEVASVAGSLPDRPSDPGL